jgi:CysZ protein
MNDFLLGVKYFFSGFDLIFRPGLRRFIIIPLLINICLFIGLFFLLRHYMAEFNAWFSHLLPHWLAWLSYILWLLFVAGFLVVFIYTFVMLGNFVAAPFNSFLAEKVEFQLTGVKPNEFTLWDNIKDIPRILGRQLAIIGYFLPRALVLLLLFFVPVVQGVAAFIWFLFSAWNMTLTYADYPTDNHRIPIANVRDWLQQRRAMALGFGVSVLVISMIPILNFFTIPAAVAGATRFWVEQYQQR